MWFNTTETTVLHLESFEEISILVDIKNHRNPKFNLNFFGIFSKFLCLKSTVDKV